MGYSDIKEMIKDARNIATGANDIQTVNLLKDITIEVYDLLEENRSLREKIHELKNHSITDSELVFRNGVYMKGAGVYCSACWDKNKDLVRVRTHPSYEREKDVLFWCDVCNTYRYSDINANEISKSKT